MAGKQMQLSVAQKMVSDYNGLCKADDIHSFKIDADMIRKIIDQNDCQYVRIFVGVSGEVDRSRAGFAPGQTLVIVGADSAGKNIKSGEDDSQVYDQLIPCPPTCGDGDGSIL